MSNWYLITGAGAGIGRAIAKRLASGSHRLILMGRTEASLEETRRLLDQSDSHRIAPADICRPEAIQAALKLTGIQSLHGVVANAGIGGGNHYGDGDRWDEIIATNLTGTYHTVRHCLDYLRANREPGGNRHVVVVSSILARLGVPGYSAYCASKAGLLGLVRSWAAEWANERILVNAICPGWVKTKMAMDGLVSFAAQSGKTVEEAFAEQMVPVPLGKMSEPEEVAALTAFLLAGGQSSITGQTLDINNGALMP